MHTKLTLRLSDSLIQSAKNHAKEQHKSLSHLVADYFAVLSQEQQVTQTILPPVTAKLKGILKSNLTFSEADYKKYLAEKYL